MTTPSLRQHAEQALSNTGSAVDVHTLGTATTAGDHVLVFMTNGSLRNVNSVSGLGATWTMLQRVTTGRRYELWSGVGCSAGQTQITVTWSSTPNDSWFSSTVWADAGVVASSAFIVGSDNHPTTASVTPTASTQMIAGGFAQAQIGAGAASWNFGVDGTDSPSAWTTIIDNDALLTPSAVYCTFEAASKTGITAAATRSVFTDTTGSWAGYGVVLETAPPAPARRPSPIHVVSGVAVARSGW